MPRMSKRPPTVPGVVTPATQITDGSQVIDHDAWDVRQWNTEVMTQEGYQEVVTQAERQMATAPALQRDLFFALKRRAPQLAEETAPPYQLHRDLLAEVLHTPEWQNLHLSVVGDAPLAAVAAGGLIGGMIEQLDAETKQRQQDLLRAQQEANTLARQTAAYQEMAEAAPDANKAHWLTQQAQKAQRGQGTLRAKMQQMLDAQCAQTQAQQHAIRQMARAAVAGAQGAVDAMQEARDTLVALGYDRNAGAGGKSANPAALKLAQAMQQSYKLRGIVEIAGRMIRIARQVQQQQTRDMPQEVTDIRPGAHLDRLVPTEYATLLDDDLGDAALMRLVQSQALEYDLHGTEPLGRGPIGIALDSSGSMSGARETWAKGVALALISLANRQRRACVIWHFSGGRHLQTYSFPPGPPAIERLIECAEWFEGGGTSYEPWMEEAMRITTTAQYAKADMICISDGETDIRVDVLARFNVVRAARGMRCWSVLIGAGHAETLRQFSDGVQVIDDLKMDRAALDMVFAL